MHFFRSAGNMVGSHLAGALFDLALSWNVPGANWYVAAACAVICLVSRDEAPGENPETTPEQEPAEAAV